MATTTPAGVREAEAHGGHAAPMSHRQIMEALSGLLLGLFVAILSSTIVSNALPTILADIGGGQSAYTWVVTGSLLAVTATTPLWGKMSDLVSKKLLIQIALVIYVLGSIIAGFSTSPGMLIACRVLQGVGAGGLSALTQVIMAAMISPRERGRYSGYLGAVFAVATVGGPLVGGVIVDTDWLGWRWCFYVGVPFAIIAIIVLQKTLHLPVVKRKVKIDWSGAFFITAAVSLLMIWVSLGGTNFAWISWQTYVMVPGAFLLGLVFLFVESRAAEPIIPLRLFRNKTITLTSFASLFVGVAMFAGTVFLSQYFQLARGKTPTMSGVMTIPLIAGLFISSTVSGQIITKTGHWKAFLVGGGVFLTAGAGTLGLLRYDTPYWQVAIYMALLGLGIGMMMQNLVLAVQNQVKPEDLGAASSLVTFFRSLGGAVGVSALGAVLGSRVTGLVSDGLAALGIKGGDGGGIPDIAKLPAPVRTVVESSYGRGIGDVFLYAAPFAFISFLLVVFVKEVALRTNSGLQQVQQVADAAAAPSGIGGTGAGQVPSVASVASVTPVLDAPATTPAPGGTPVHGTVRINGGTAVSLAKVTLISLQGQQLGKSVTGTDGRYLLDAPGSGSYVLIAAADGHQPQASTVLVGDAPLPYDMVLAGTGGLTGTVVNAVDTATVVEAMVVVTDVRGEVLGTGKTGDGGEFAFPELPGGDYTVSVNAPGFRPTALPVEVTGSGACRVAIALQPGTQVRGIVRAGADRRPLPDAKVVLVDAAGNVAGTTTTGSDGAYAFTDLDAGEYSLVASGYPPLATALTVRGRAAEEFDVELNHPEG
ncbi:MFS transporter [Streptomyces sp. H10-C2]|uniref:MFS transporter n=1 Tax=unclassified Streptomyces TaxID=2593676 RepID=UPI0024B93E81|nr:MULTISPECIES: MFS transporter [unclassified Streptomyces]MDJ0342115.1 MFS transporter [Streptomyces sp. PH10-H1]MDJ0368457.1 MFS transporter [Streptomyces sp. H10-C2]